MEWTILAIVLHCVLALPCHCMHAQPNLLSDMQVNNGAPIRAGGDEDFEVELVVHKSQNHQQSRSGSNREIKKLWGTDEAEAYVGKIFTQSLTNNVLYDNIKNIQVISSPDWLTWHRGKRLLQGVPNPRHVGLHHVTVSAKLKDGNEFKALLVVRVRPLPGELLRIENGCVVDDDITVLSVVFAASLQSLTAKDKLQLLQNTAHAFHLKQDIVFLGSAPSGDPLLSDMAQQAGPGSASPDLVRHATAPRMPLAQVQWGVGCGGLVSFTAQGQVDDVEVKTLDGSLQALLNMPVIGWNIVQLNPKTHRVRRDAVDGSEDYSGDGLGDYDYEYDYDYSIFGNLGTSFNNPDDYQPEERIIPSLTTPVFGDDSVPTSAAPNFPPHTPVLHVTTTTSHSHHQITTPALIPVKPTRIVVQPTPVYGSVTPSEMEDFQPTSTVPISQEPSQVDPHREKPPSVTPTITQHPTEDTTMYDVRNFAPTVANRIPKLAWIAGNVYRMKIPSETFNDLEDGNADHLNLFLKNEKGLNLGLDSWIQFDPANREIYALPLEQHIGKYDFRLEATDSGGKSVMELLKVHVQQSKQARNFHHKFTAVFKLVKENDYYFAYSLDWQMKAVEKIAAFFNDSLDSMNVRSLSLEPVKLTWTNVSLVDPQSTVCPAQQLYNIINLLVESDGHTPTKELREAFEPEFLLKKVHVHLLQPCERILHHREETGETLVGIAEGGSGVRQQTYENNRPIFRNQIDKLTATAGMLFTSKVKEDTCYDMEDGDTRRLQMRLLTTDLSTPPLDSWLQFDAANQEFFGLPLQTDVGSRDYVLECIDRGGEKVSDALVVVVNSSPSSNTPQPVRFNLVVNTDFQELMSNAQLKSRLVQHIAGVFGDSSPDNVVVESLEAGSAVVWWHNQSLPTDLCPSDIIQVLRHVMMDDNANLRDSFRQFFLPDFEVQEGQVVPAGVCLAPDTPTHAEEADVGAPAEEEISTSDEDYLLTFIVPAVIIAVMLLLAALIACCLYRRRRYGKMTMADNSTFVSKGIPIIFAEELDDQRPDPVKSPVIMKEEKPPLPPPEYHTRGSPTAGGTPPTAKVGDRRRQQNDPVNDDAPYHPPPPFTSSNGGSRNPRPNLPPAYRKPPTYVPP